MHARDIDCRVIHHTEHANPGKDSQTLNLW